MAKLSLLLAIWLGAFAFSYAAEGDPTWPARLEFVYSGAKLMAKLDGATLEATEGMKATVEVGHGGHLLEIYEMKGLFKAEKIADRSIDLPGGWITRATWTGGELKILGQSPQPGWAARLNETAAAVAVQEPDAIPLASSTTTTVSRTTTTTTSGVAPGTESVSMRVEIAELPGMAVSMQVSGQKTVTRHEATTIATNSSASSSALRSVDPPVVAPVRPSKLTLLSEEGMCTVHLDGRERLELPMSGIDELASGTIFDLLPGRYLLKIEGFDVWYEGPLDVGSGEEIKVRTEPGRFEILARNPLP